ncbi:MAG: exopolyphosphatase [SAR324 cluster bacterium]|nr:exopolyphosphatase [SAR324 cluster bacterium]
MSDNQSYRLVTRSDFDGLVCAVLLKEQKLVSDILFVHPKDMQDQKIAITNKDIVTNLPYVEGCFLCFDHHHSEIIRRGGKQPENHIIDPDAQSAARVVYDYYGGEKTFTPKYNEMMAAVDKGDAAQFSKEEILDPTGWVLLNYLMDARTGLGRFRDFRISNYELMMQLIDYCREHSIDQILNLPDVAERIELYFEHAEKSKEQIQRCSTVHGNLVVLDLRNEETIYTGNRFMIYALYPETNISIHVMWGLKQQNTVFAIGNSIIKRDSKTDIGALALKYGGGGHVNAGTCQVANDQAEKSLKELIQQITANG